MMPSRAIMKKPIAINRDCVNYQTCRLSQNIYVEKSQHQIIRLGYSSAKKLFILLFSNLYKDEDKMYQIVLIKP